MASLTSGIGVCKESNISLVSAESMICSKIFPGRWYYSSYNPQFRIGKQKEAKHVKQDSWWQLDQNLNSVRVRNALKKCPIEVYSKTAKWVFPEKDSINKACSSIF
jgi:hypothetical protein